MKKEILIVVVASVLVMLYGIRLMLIGFDEYILAGSIMISGGLFTIAILVIASLLLQNREGEQNAIPQEVDENSSTQNPSESVEKLAYKKLVELHGGKVLQIIEDKGYWGSTEVRIDNLIPEDGFYLTKKGTIAYKLTSGKIEMEYYIESFKQTDGSTIEIGGNRVSGIDVNSPVWINKTLALDGAYKKGRRTIEVKNGVIVKNK